MVVEACDLKQWMSEQGREDACLQGLGEGLVDHYPRATQPITVSSYLRDALLVQQLPSSELAHDEG